MSRRWGGLSLVVAVGLQLGVSSLAQAQALRPSAQLQRPATAAAPATGTVDYIVVLVNSEPVTNFDVRQRLLRVEQQLASQGQSLPPREQLLPQVLEQLVVERAQLQQASELGMRVDEATLLQAEQAIAAQNQLDLEAFRRRVVSEGMDLNRLRNELRNQVLLQRLREREVESRVRVSEADIDSFIRERQSANPEAMEINLGHVLIQVPEGASAARVSELQARAQGVADRLRAGADFAEQAREHSESPEAASGGQMGLRSIGRLPELFVEATRSLPTGGVAGPLRSAAGFHVLKVIERRQSAAPDFSVTQTRARHILLRPGPQLNQADAVARLAQFRQQIASGQANFETLARQHSQDGSAREGGDLGWVSPGQFVPEFEEAMNRLPLGGISAPVVSRFGVHLIQVLERREVALETKQLREQARAQLREQKFDEAYAEWARDLRARAYVEMREPPL